MLRRQGGFDVGPAGPHFGPFGQPGLVSRRLGEHTEHVVRPQVERALIRVESVAVVPVDAIQAQGQRGDQQGGQQKIRPPQPAQGGEETKPLGVHGQ